ncbi:hypothetical protein E6P97_03590 [Patescibacteria group bacterium]|nr:MAG: hypothetical protein E6P97_03590 [Patescibacteria group bacterium]
MRLAESNRLVLRLSGLVLMALLGTSVVVFFFFATSPRDIGALGVTIWFVSLFLAISSVVTLIRYVFRARKTESQYRLVALLEVMRSSVLLSLFFTVGLAMQSLRALSAGDIVLFLLTLAIIEIYFRTK